MKSALELEAERLAGDLDVSQPGADPAAAAGESPPGIQSQAPHQEQPGADVGGPEVIQNPAPQIAAALRKARNMPRVRLMVPARVLEVFSDDQIEALALAIGNVLVKYELSAPSWFDRYKDELALVWVSFCLYLSLSEALAAAPMPRADERDVTPKAGDPPPHVDGEAQPL